MASKSSHRQSIIQGVAYRVGKRAFEAQQPVDNYTLNAMIEEYCRNTQYWGYYLNLSDGAYKLLASAILKESEAHTNRMISLAQEEA